MKDTKVRIIVYIIYVLETSHEQDDPDAEDYDEELQDCITGEGLLQFASDLDVDPMDIVLLIIFWKLKAKRQYVLSRSEFIDGFRNLG